MAQRIIVLRHQAWLCVLTIVVLLQALVAFAWMRTRGNEPQRLSVRTCSRADAPVQAKIAPAPGGDDGTAAPLLASFAVRQDDIRERQPVRDDSAWASPPCAGPLQLRAILASRERDWSFAVLARSPDQVAEIVRAGDRFQQGTVWHIGSDRLWLKNEQALCQVRMFEHAPANGATASAEPSDTRGDQAQTPASAILRGVRKVDDHAFEVDRATLGMVLEDPARALAGVRVMPATTSDGTKGFRIAGLRANSLLSQLGLRNGDMLVSIDRQPLSDPRVALEALARLPRAERAALGFMRNQQELTLDLTIR
ncbi:MAG: hypothetical protein MUF54_07695 [Polyangiaceae bacterium]|jgi:type II secretory pathway component PulC|nr:hypothetical protein [Polyangiaceae bacterium]